MLLERDAMSDEEMVRAQRANLLDPMAPNPSVETLLHAFIPRRFVDHTHATAVLSLIDQLDGEARAADLYDGRMAIVPYVMPGFASRRRAGVRRRIRDRAHPPQARHLHFRGHRP